MESPTRKQTRCDLVGPLCCVLCSCPIEGFVDGGGRATSGLRFAGRTAQLSLRGWRSPSFLVKLYAPQPRKHVEEGSHVGGLLLDPDDVSSGAVAGELFCQLLLRKRIHLFKGNDGGG